MGDLQRQAGHETNGAAHRQAARFTGKRFEP
jgi:hypothetical protein